MQDKGSGSSDEVSSNESASVVGTAEKSLPLGLVQEFSLKSLMVSRLCRTCGVSRIEH